ncbi:zinc finger protein Pegasus-like [Coregonus clupeaformis]|uniref:zinc finger protein Pegasus-like n=1 Tax=Coregonus clupeaformis TaxID=59861 RepID=UPI001E1C9AC9|nr:zinc finger protein Pegasus-like [Coregonus clupeaformis]
MDDDLKPLDFIKDFQEYLTQQTHHVNMISGSVGGEIEPDHLQAVAAAIPESDHQNGSVEVSLDERSGLLVDGFQRTYDGKLKCSYCSYASKGTARLIEHIRIHTGEKPHHCQLCPFASAYERHLEAHMRSHTGEKPYKCDLCSFRCSDRSNLSHHRRRRHKLLPTKGSGLPSSLSDNKKKMLSVLQKNSGLGGYSRRLLIDFSPPSMVVGKPDYLNHEVSESLEKNHGTGGGGGGGGASRDVHSDMMVVSNPLNQLSTPAGQLSDLPQEDQTPVSPDRLSCHDVKPFLIQQESGAPIAVSVSLSTSQSGAHHHYHHHHHTSSPTSPEDLQPPAGHSRNYSPSPVDPEPSSEHSTHTRTSSASISNSQPSTPALPGSTQDSDPQMLHSCQHCDTYFSDNIMYTIHMGCHGYENPFQCNICGCKCRNKYDFACHFARGQHKH